MAIACTECGREVDEFTTIAEKWMYHYDGSGLIPFCPACVRREFADDAPASAAWPRARSRDASSSGFSS